MDGRKFVFARVHIPALIAQKYRNREKSLRHVALVAKFLDDNKPKIHLKSKFALFQTSSVFKLYSISFNLSNVGEIFWIEFKRTVSEFRKRKRNFLCFVHLLRKEGALNYEVSCRSHATMTKKCVKKRDARAKLLFCQKK